MATIINNPSGPSAPSTSGEGEGLSAGILVGIILVIVIALLLIFGLPALRGGGNTNNNEPAPTTNNNQGQPEYTPGTNVEGQIDVSVE